MTDAAVINMRAADTVRELRKSKARKLGLRLGLGVGLPTVLAAVYYGLIASPQYESVSQFTIQSADSGGAASLELLAAVVPSGSTGRDALVVQEYVQSRDMLRVLLEQHGFEEHYGDESVDYLSRLSPSASFEDKYDYYRDVLDVEHDTASGVVTMRFRAFSAAKAEELSEVVLRSGERMVNEMMATARHDRIELAQKEVQAAEERLSVARQKVLELQAERAELNPEASAQAIYAVRGNIESELAHARAELSTLRATLQPGAPQLVAAQQRVSALSRQVEEQNRRLAGGGDGALDVDMAEFEPAMAEKEFAQQALMSALKSLELARLEVDRQHRYLVTISQPSTPDAPTHPETLLSVLTVFLLSFALLSIGSLLLASVREHANL